MARDWRRSLWRYWPPRRLRLCARPRALRPSSQPSSRQGASQIAARKQRTTTPTTARDAEARRRPRRRSRIPPKRSAPSRPPPNFFEAGKAEQAAQALTAVLAGGNLPPAIMAKAPSIARHCLSAAEQACAGDLRSDERALAEGRASAERSRGCAASSAAAAYSDAGLTESGEIARGCPPVATERGTRQGSKPERPRRASKSWGAVTTPADALPATRPRLRRVGGNWFKNWFGIVRRRKPSPRRRATPHPSTTSESSPRRAPPASAPRVASAWSQQAPRCSPRRRRPSRAPHGRPAAAATAEGKFRVQLATVRTQEEAPALAAKAKRDLPALSPRATEIDQAVLGNMGSFYRVRVGPFATVQETQAVCAKAQGHGFDCLAVTQ